MDTVNNTHQTQKKKSSFGMYCGVILIAIFFGGFSSIVTSVAFNGFEKLFTENEGSPALETQLQSGTEGADEKRVIVKEESAVIDAVKKVQPSTVSIIATKDLQTLYNQNGADSLNDPFGLFFEQPQQQQESTPPGEAPRTRVGGGTGFFISEDGLILTNKHVVDDETAEYAVFDLEGNEYTAQVLAKDPIQDLAVIKIEGNDFPVAELGDSSVLEAGQTVIAVGNALGEYTDSVTKGVLSGVGRSIVAGSALTGESEQLDGVLQTDAAINPGNSGGPLVNIDGQVIGINTAIDASGQLIGFAIPVNDAKEVVKMVIENGRIIRPYLGVRYLPITRSIAEDNSLPVDFGALVVRGDRREDLAVLPGSPADKAGIVENDIILEIDGNKVDINFDVAQYIRKQKVGERIELRLLHQGEEKTVTVTLEERK